MMSRNNPGMAMREKRSMPCSTPRYTTSAVTARKSSMNTTGAAGGGDEAGEIAVPGGIRAPSGEIGDEIFGDPAADDGVIGHDDGGHQKGEISQKAPAPVHGAEGRSACSLVRRPMATSVVSRVKPKVITRTR